MRRKGKLQVMRLRAAEKTWRYKVAAENIFVFMHMNNLNNDPFHSNGAWWQGSQRRPTTLGKRSRWP